MKKRQPFTFTLHAVDRYVQRFDVSVSRQEATRRLGDASLTALRTRRTTGTGEEIWICEVLGRRVDCVIKRERGHAVCLTVEPEGSGWSYVHEQRVSLPMPADPSADALRIAVRYAVASAARGEERAARVVAEIRRIAPWALSGLEPANDRARGDSEIEDAPHRDRSDGEPASSLLNAATGTEER